MGGAKKRSIVQVEKQQKFQAAKKQKAGSKTRKAEAKEDLSRISLKDIDGKDLTELAKIKALTPYAVATKYNLRISAAKEVLEMLENRKMVQQVAGSGGVKIYKFIGNV